MKKKIVLLISLVIVGSGILFLLNRYLPKNTIDVPRNSLLSKKVFTNEKYGVAMYPPEGWYAKQDDYFNAQILFLDQPMPTISDFSNSNSIITLSIYPYSELLSSAEGYIEQVKKEFEYTIQLSRSIEKDDAINNDLLSLNSRYSLFNDAIKKKEAVIVDNIDGVTYNFGSYFGGTGIGKTIILEKDGKLFVIIAEVRDEDTWVQNSEKITQSMMSFRLVK